MDIPVDLKNALEAGNCVLFVGAGMGHNMKTQDGLPLPDGKQLAEMIANKFSMPALDEYSLTDVSTYIELQKDGRKDLVHYLRSILQDASPDEYMQWIPTVKWRAIYTTNYDRAIQKAYELCDKPAQEYVTITHISEYDDFDYNQIVPIIHLHGSLFEGRDTNNIIISQTDYINYAERRQSLFALLKQCFVKNCVLFTGYSHKDANFKSVLAEINREVYPYQLRPSYRIAPETDPVSKAILQKQQISTLDILFSDFVIEARSQLTLKETVSLSIEEAKGIIPSAFWGMLEHALIPLNRLFHSWEYVNQINLTGYCDMHGFVRGNKASWDIIMNKRYFPRIIEEDLELELLDYATSNKTRVNICTITGPAGYGSTTLLMILASKVVKSKMGHAFYLKDGKKLNEGDVFFAYDNITDNSKCFFFVDNAADHANEIRDIIKHAREQKKGMVFVLADRSNELDRAGMLRTGESFCIQPLADSEIEYIIDFLKENDELNKLEHLKREDQAAAIKINYNRELLVTIREATEGKSFDAIIQDEYIGIGDLFSQQAYELICCFHQFDIPMRMELLVSLLRTSEVEFYQHTKAPLNGVIHYDLYNIDKNSYVARTRQRLIAHIVWEYCITDMDKEDIINTILAGINITHYLDRKAFEQLYRSEELVDGLPSFESKMHFFSRACSIDPSSAYVRQHFARMLARNNQDELALSMIDQAIKMDKSIRVLYHTKGCILHQMAVHAETLELGRKRRAQSEEEFYTTIRMKDTDSYGYLGISELYIDWAKRTNDASEESLYLAKAEEILQKALAKVPDKENIWVELSKIDKYISDTPSQIEKLRKAVALSPDSPMANYLLAKALISNEKYDEAVKILQRAFRYAPQEYRTSMEYAKAVIMKQNGSCDSIREGIAILQQSTLYGYSDPFFIATLGGLLFLDKRFDESDRVFQEAHRRELRHVFYTLFHPISWNIPNTFNGTVKYVGDGKSQILVDGYCEVMCPSSKVEGIVLHRNMKVKVDIKFQLKGPVAYISSI